MGLETVIFQQDPFIYSTNEDNYSHIINLDHDDVNHGSYNNWETSSPPSNSGVNVADQTNTSTAYSSPESGGRRKRRRRTKSMMKNKEDMENQRMTHIAVERNRRRQMNDYLAVLRSLMPPSYAQRGDQASIIGGAINFVKELEQLVQFQEAHKPANQQPPRGSKLFSNFFTFPQYSESPNATAAAVDEAAERRQRPSGTAGIEVTVVESHANIKILTKRRPKQVLKLVAEFQSIGLTILHLNITTVDQSVLFSFSVKVEDECHLTTVNEIATTVHDIVGMIQEEFVV